MKRKFVLAGFVLASLCVTPLLLHAQNHPPPPPPMGGSVIFDPGAVYGVTPLPTSYTEYSATFTATATSTDITFAFRHDPGYFAFDDASVSTGMGPNLFLNPGFETGDLTDWHYDNMYGVSFAGVVATACGAIPPNSGSFLWCDGATQGYDAIDQVVATTVGDTYTVSFWMNQYDATGHSTGFFQDLSTNGLAGTSGNATGVLVYVGNGPPPPTTPEPGTLALLGSGALGIAGILRRKLS